eukprot:m.188164 g.188164  ORF g.188164 m.188164 type:complete len:598 (+) comp17313_c0_seq1:37-1830(+)
MEITLPPQAQSHVRSVKHQVSASTEGDTQDNTGTPAEPPVDKKAVDRLCVKLRKTLERPEQAQLELDPLGWLPISALGGKFRHDKLASIVGLHAKTSTPAYVAARFKKLVNKWHPSEFEWRHDEATGHVLVRLKGASGSRTRAAARALEADSEARYMFPGDNPHSLRGLVERGPSHLRELLQGYGIRLGVPIVFLEPRGVAEYRGVPNEPVLEMLHALHASDDYQLAILTWVGTDSLGPRLGTMRGRAELLLSQFGLHGVPAFSASGTRAGLVALAQQVAAALDTTAVVLTRGKDVLEASFSSRFLRPLSESVGHAEVSDTPLVTVWSYASQSMRSTSSTGSGGRRSGGVDTAGGDGDSPDGAADFAVMCWNGVASSLSSGDALALKTRSKVLVDAIDIVTRLTKAEAGGGGSTPETSPALLSVQDVIRRGATMPLPSDPSVFTGLFDADDPSASASAASLAAARSRLPAAGLLVTAALLQDDTDALEWMADHGDVVAELAPSTVEQQRLLTLVAHAFDHKWTLTKYSVLRVLKALHEADIVEDEGFQRWEQSATARSVSPAPESAFKEAGPFLTWLAESQDDDVDDEDAGDSDQPA